MRKLQKFTLPVLIGIFLLILAACGGDDESEATSVATTGESFEFQYVCVNRTLLPCQVVQEYLDTVNTRTEDRLRFS